MWADLHKEDLVHEGVEYDGPKGGHGQLVLPPLLHNLLHPLSVHLRGEIVAVNCVNWTVCNFTGSSTNCTPSLLSTILYNILHMLSMHPREKMAVQFVISTGSSTNCTVSLILTLPHKLRMHLRAGRGSSTVWNSTNCTPSILLLTILHKILHALSTHLREEMAVQFFISTGSTTNSTPSLLYNPPQYPPHAQHASTGKDGSTVCNFYR